MRVEKISPHGDRLIALLNNDKLPARDKPRVANTIKRYNKWVKELDAAHGTPDEILSALVSALNDYKTHVEVDLIFDSRHDFLYRQKGQLKLDNTILEEFLPRLFDVRLVPGFGRLENIECANKPSFSHMSFGSPLLPLSEGGVFFKEKDQDFSVSKRHRVTITDLPAETDTHHTDIRVSYFATEIKTNLDKTMFQEASMTAAELKSAVPGAQYVLLCEYLDMTPINTNLSAIDEVIILRKVKRINSNVRNNYSTAAGRAAGRAAYVAFLRDNPLHKECFERFLYHLRACFPEAEQDAENVVLTRGYF